MIASKVKKMTSLEAFLYADVDSHRAKRRTTQRWKSCSVRWIR